jgi:hypothetical protein
LTEKHPCCSPLIKRTILEKSLDVLPAKRLLGEEPSLLLALKIVPKARYKEIFPLGRLGETGDYSRLVA